MNRDSSINNGTEDISALTSEMIERGYSIARVSIKPSEDITRLRTILDSSQNRDIRLTNLLSLNPAESVTRDVMKSIEGDRDAVMAEAAGAVRSGRS